MVQAAARLHDPIEHTRALGGLIAGAIIGGAIAVITLPATAPILLAGAAIAGATVGGAALGELAGSLSFAKTIEGDITVPCSTNVFINGKPAARAHIDMVDCHRHPARPPVAQGSSNVFINGQPAARKGDRAGCDAVIAAGSPNVFIGGGTVTTDEISPEVPAVVHTTMMVVGLASAAILFGPVAAAAGFIGGIVGGEAMHYVGGKLFGEGSDGQKLMTFGGGLMGGLAAGKGGAWFERNYEVSSAGLGANGGNIRITPKTGETASTASGKAIHAEQAAARRASGDFDLVNSPLTDAAGNPIHVPKRVDLGTGLPADSRTQVARPDAVNFNRRLVLDDKPVGRPIAKDRQEIIRFIDAYNKSQGEMPKTIAIQRYDPITGRPVVTELFDPSDFLP